MSIETNTPTTVEGMALAMLVAAGHVSQSKVDESIALACAAIKPALAGQFAERYAAIGRAIERGAEELPEGYQLSVYVEKDSGTADLQDPDGDNVFFESDEGLAGSINAAIDAAINEARETQR
jgi:hypothetical protein